MVRNQENSFKPNNRAQQNSDGIKNYVTIQKFE